MPPLGSPRPRRATHPSRPVGPACGRVRRPDPGVDLDDMFLFEATRRVSRARTVSLDGRTCEVEAG